MEADGRILTIHNPYEDTGSNSYKGQLHIHSYPGSTDVSDTANTPTHIGEEYRDAGYDFYSITDHAVITPDPAVAGITWLGDGIESFYIASHGHVLSWNTSFNDDSVATQEMIDGHRAAGGLACIAHPDLGTLGTTREDLLELENYNCIEITNPYRNTAPDGGMLVMEDTWDYLLSHGKKVWGIAVDDTHSVDNEPERFNKGWVDVKANDNTAPDLLAALEKGDFYASTGSDLRVSVTGTTIDATCTDSSTIQFIGKHGEVLQTDTSATSASYDITGRELYIRVRATKDSDSTQGFSQPIFIECVDNHDVAPSTGYANHQTLYRNALINGNFDIWQRGTSFTGSGDYTADRWWMFESSCEGTMSRQVLNDSFGAHAMRMTLNSKSAPYNLSLIQPIETINSVPFKGKNVNFNLWVRRNSTFNAGELEIVVYASEGTNEMDGATGRTAFVKTYNWDEIALANAGTYQKGWTRINVPAYVTNDKTQLVALVRMRHSSIPAGSYIELRQCQLNLGSKPIDYQQRFIDDELMMCQRYYYKLGGGGQTRSVPSSVSTTTAARIYQPLPVTMRASVGPSVHGTRGTDWIIRRSNDDTNTTGSIDTTATSAQKDVGLIRIGSGTFSDGGSYHWMGLTTSGTIRWDAELY